MRRLLFALLLVLTLAVPALAGDTGTYKILDYQVLLTPRSTGLTEIACTLRWEVTGGNIPWITVGLPNDHWKLLESGGAVAKASSGNQGGWSGVRLDLDRAYRPGETFEVRFKVEQDHLFYAEEEAYHLKYTPGWYDRAATEHLSVGVRFFADLETVSSDPAPSNRTDETLYWQRSSLGRGERFTVHVTIPKTTFGEIPADHLKAAKGNNLRGLIFLIIVVVLILALISFLNDESGGGGGGRGGSYSSPVFSSAGRRSSSSSSRSSSGGGGFGGRSSSCACACVSCACACACAGGGGAGCSRKTTHSCPSCAAKHDEAAMQRDANRRAGLLTILCALVLVAALVFTLSGQASAAGIDANTQVSQGEPAFPSLGTSWAIDQAGVLKPETEKQVDATFERLKRDGVAEVVLLTITGVKNPEDYATKFGRHLGLGKKGEAAAGGQRGLVWMVRPEAQNKLTVSVGRGLPRFTAADYGAITDQVIEYFNFGNYDKGARRLAELTDARLRQLYPPKEVNP